MIFGIEQPGVVVHRLELIRVEMDRIFRRWTGWIPYILHNVVVPWIKRVRGTFKLEISQVSLPAARLEVHVGIHCRVTAADGLELAVAPDHHEPQVFVTHRFERLILGRVGRIGIEVGVDGASDLPA